MATAPTEEVFSVLSAVGVQVVPPLVVFQRPPPVVPK